MEIDLFMMGEMSDVCVWYDAGHESAGLYLVSGALTSQHGQLDIL